MKDILILNDTLKYGGTETLLVDIVNYLSVRDYNITLLLPFPTENNILLKELSPGVTVKYIYAERPSRLKKIILENIMSFMPRLHNKITKLNLGKYDTLVSFKDNVYSIILSRSKQKKLLWIHNLPTIDKYESKTIKEYFPVKLLKKRMYRLIQSFRKFNEVVCVSEICKNRYINVFNNGKIPSHQKVSVLYNAINSAQILNLSKQAFNQIPQHPSFVMVTRFSVEKRVDRVIRAVRKLKDEGYNFSVYIIGDGILRNRIEALINELELNDTIKLLGYIENPYPFLKENDWLVSSSERESFSLVLLESILLGVPVITTDCGGPSEITDKGKYGLLTENSTLGVYQGMRTVLDTPSISETFTSRSEECLKRFDYQKWLESAEKIIGS